MAHLTKTPAKFPPLSAGHMGYLAAPQHGGPFISCSSPAWHIHHHISQKVSLILQSPSQREFVGESVLTIFLKQSHPAQSPSTPLSPSPPLSPPPPAQHLIPSYRALALSHAKFSYWFIFIICLLHIECLNIKDVSKSAAGLGALQCGCPQCGPGCFCEGPFTWMCTGQ